MITGLDHVQLAMPRGREELARSFYAGLLGMTELPKPPVLAARGGCWFASGTAVLHLGVEEPFTPARKAHPALLTDDLERACAAVLTAVEATPASPRTARSPACAGSTRTTPSATGSSSSRPDASGGTHDHCAQPMRHARRGAGTCAAACRFIRAFGHCGVHNGGIAFMLDTWTQTRSLRSVR